MGSSFHDLLLALEAEHERKLAECRWAASDQFEVDLEKPDVPMSAAVSWRGESEVLSHPPLSEGCGEMGAASTSSAQVFEPMVAQKLGASAASDMLESESPLTPVRRSSSSQHTGRFDDPDKLSIAQKVLLVTSFLDGPGGIPCCRKPLSSSPPSRMGWLCLWAALCAYSVYHMCRVFALMFSSNLHGDDLMAASLFFTCYTLTGVIPFLVCRGKFISRCRAFAAAMSTILSEARADSLLDDLKKAVQLMHKRRLAAIFMYISVELMLLFGPSRAPYRKIALWPWPQTDGVSVLHAVVSSIVCSMFFMADVDLIMLTTIKHATLALRSHLEVSPTNIVHEQYDFLCDFLEDYFEVEASTLKYPFAQLSINTLILLTAFANNPDSHYLPYFLYVTLVGVAVFLKDMFTFADQNASIAALADAAFKRSFHDLNIEDSMEDLHLKLCVTHRRPALVVLGVLEVTRPGLVGLMSFLLSLAFVIIFEMRT